MSYCNCASSNMLPSACGQIVHLESQSFSSIALLLVYSVLTHGLYSKWNDIMTTNLGIKQTAQKTLVTFIAYTNR